jgi:hypothetical protein
MQADVVALIVEVGRKFSTYFLPSIIAVLIIRESYSRKKINKRGKRSLP